MKELVDKFIELEREIAEEKGKFALFALFLREDGANKWDLVVASPWIESSRKDALSYIANKITAKLTPEELTDLSRVVLIDEANPALNTILQTVRVEDGAVRVQDSTFFGMGIKLAYFITSRKSNVNAGVHAT